MGGTRGSVAGRSSAPGTTVSIEDEARRIYEEFGGNMSYVDRLKIAEEIPGPQSSWAGVARGREISLTPETMKNAQRFLRGDRDRDAAEGYTTLVHEIYHIAQPRPHSPDMNWVTEAVTSMRSEAYVKSRHPEVASLIRERYSSSQTTLRLLSAANGGESFVTKLLNAESTKSYKNLMSRASRKYVEDLVQRRGGSSSLATQISSSMRNPSAIRSHLADLEVMTAPWQVARFLTNYTEAGSRGLDWRGMK